VPSFGLPTNRANIGWDLDLPDNVINCFHALSLDERRNNFKLHRPEARVDSADQGGRLGEVWFRGVHSDVGGGNRNQGLSSIALHWMFAKAVQCGLPIDRATVRRNRARMKPDAPISVHSFDPVKNKFRVVRWNDQVHATVRARTDTRKRQHNNPPVGVPVVNDAGRKVRKFKRSAS
jgi:hypothetical protein